MAYLPKKYDPSPALVIELKAGGTPEEAMEQMRSRNYASSLEGLGSNLLLVAITYDKKEKTKAHHCMIEDASGEISSLVALTHFSHDRSDSSVG